MRTALALALLARVSFAETIVGTIHEEWEDPANRNAPDISLGLSYSGTAPSGELPPGARTTIQIAAASDADGDPLTFFWKVNVGTVTGTSGNFDRIEVLLPTPELPTDFIVNAYASDNRGKVAEKQMRFSIGPRLNGNTLLHTSSRPEVYLVQGGSRRWIVSAEVFIALGMSWSGIHDVSTRFMDSIPEGARINEEDVPTENLNRLYRDGSLIMKPGGPEVYVMEYGRRRWITGAALFESLGYLWEDIHVIPASVLARIPEGPRMYAASVSFSEGTLVQTNGRPHVYTIDMRGKRHIVSAELFVALGYRWENIVNISASQLDAIPTGPPIEPIGDTSLAVGSIFKSPNDHAVYRLDEYPFGKFKRHIMFERTVFSLGYRWSDLRILPHATVMRIPTGPPLW